VVVVPDGLDRIGDAVVGRDRDRNRAFLLETRIDRLVALSNVKQPISQSFGSSSGFDLPQFGRSEGMLEKAAMLAT
jgi:hypothetical protein